MSTFLRLIPLEMESLDKIVEPDREFNPEKDHEVGIMTDDLKKLFTVWKNYIKGAAEQKFKAQFDETPEEKQFAKINSRSWSRKQIYLLICFG